MGVVLAMSIDRVQRAVDRAIALKKTLENQRTIVAAMAEAYTHLWSDEDLRLKCDEILREVSREAVRTAREWLDLARELDRFGQKLDDAKEVEPDDLPF